MADVDGDGLLDIYFVNQVGGNQLWRNLGGGRFEDITAAAGVAVPGKISVSASFADIDNDGDADLYVTTVRGGNMLFENDGHGRFRDISAASGLELRRALLGRGVLRLRPRRPARPLPRQRRPLHHRHDRRRRRLQVLRRLRGRVLRPPEAGAGGSAASCTTTRAATASSTSRSRRACMDMSWSGDASALDVNDDGWPDLYVLNMQGDDQVLRERRRQAASSRRAARCSRGRRGARWASRCSTSTTTAASTSSSPTCTPT